MKIIDLIDAENLERDRRKLREYDKKHKFVRCACKCVYNDDGVCKKSMVVIDVHGQCTLMIGGGR